MKDKVYPSSSVTPYHNQFIWANLNVDLQAARKIMPKFKVQGVPYLVILSPVGEVLAVNRGLIKSESFVKMLDHALAKMGATQIIAPKSAPKTTPPSSSAPKPKSIFKNQ